MSDKDISMHKINWQKIRSDQKLLVGFSIFLLAFFGLISCWAIEYFIGLRVYRLLVMLFMGLAIVDVLALASYSYDKYLKKS